MLYELRVYEMVPGKMPDINARFANVTTKLFEKHGIKVIGFWENLIGTSNQLIYMVAWESLAEREKKWDAFGADPDWIKARAASEEKGPIVARAINTILRPTSYSAMK
jgi:hypothetical protein